MDRLIEDVGKLSRGNALRRSTQDPDEPFIRPWAADGGLCRRLWVRYAAGMARPPRIDFPDALYHATSRGNGRRRVFWSDADRQRFLGQLADGVHTAGVVLYAFVLMDNHFHLLVRTPRANLSRFMQRLEAYPWSSYPGYVDVGKKLEFVCYDLLAEYGRTQAEARRQYRAYTHACVLEDDGPILAAMAASRYAIGRPEFVEGTERRLAKRRTGRPQDRDLALPRVTIGIENVDQAVLSYYGTTEEALRKKGPGAGPAKFVAVELACRLTGMTQRGIGAHYGGITSAAVSNIRRRLRQGRYPLQDVVEHLLET